MAKVYIVHREFDGEDIVGVYATPTAAAMGMHADVARVSGHEAAARFRFLGDDWPNTSHHSCLGHYWHITEWEVGLTEPLLTPESKPEPEPEPDRRPVYAQHNNNPSRQRLNAFMSNWLASPEDQRRAISVLVDILAREDILDAKDIEAILYTKRVTLTRGK